MRSALNLQAHYIIRFKTALEKALGKGMMNAYN